MKPSVAEHYGCKCKALWCTLQTESSKSRFSLRKIYKLLLPLLCNNQCSGYKPLAYTGGGGGVLPYMDYTGMCRSTGYGFFISESGTGSTNQRFCLEQGILFDILTLEQRSG